MSLMSIVWMIVVGFVVGVLARFFYPGAVNLGFWMTVLLGIGGSIVGGVIGGLFGGSSDGKFRPAGWFLSIVGALILLWAYLNYFAK
ncbi:MAG: GlsB/YeaQ/YmgE family stress response membrane protein [Burkholderiales bacterium]